MWRLTRFGEIVWGWGSLSYLSQLKGSRALLVTSRGALKRLGFVDKAAGYLAEGFGEVRVYEGIEPNPRVSTALKLAKFMAGYKPDTIVALGGGSVMDAAKAAWILYECPSLSLEDVIRDSSLVPRLGSKARLVAVPTTSGTGSEVSRGCVLTDDETQVKYAIVSLNLVPTLAILDPELPASMPRDLTADSGMDAMSHALESHASKAASDFTKPLSLSAFTTIWIYLRRAYGDPSDREAREKMHYAQCIAALAFTNAGTGAIHAISHVISVPLGLSHGRANAVLMPYVVYYNAQTCPDPYLDLALSVGIDSTEEDVGFELASALLDYNKRLGIPQSFSEVGANERVLISRVEKYMSYILGSAPMRTNPRSMAAEDVKEVVRLAWSGELG